MDLAIITDP